MRLTLKTTAVLSMLLHVMPALKTDQRGRSFLITFLKNDNDTLENLITITSEYDATVYVQMSNTKTQEYQIESLGTAHISFPHSAATVTSDIQVDGNTAFIVASTNVFVYGYAIGTSSIGGFLALPVEGLGMRYLTVAKSDGGQLAVAATEDDTQVSIVMKLNGNAECGNMTLNDGQELKFKLKKREALHMACNTDTSGTLVRADKPVAVFTGSRFSEDIEMVPPIQSLGMEYILYPILGRNAETVYRILAAEDNTVVTSSKWTYKLGSRDFIDITLRESDYTCFRSTKPVMVAQFTKNGNGQIMSILPSTDHFAAAYVMDTTVGGYYRNVTPYVTAVIPKTTHLVFMPPSAVHVIDECQYRVGTVEIGSGINTLSQADGSPFGIMAYGFGDGEMYSFPAGLTFKSSDTQECANVTCENNGLCYETRGSYECFCAKDFDGQHCEFNISNAEESPTSELPTTKTLTTDTLLANESPTTDLSESSTADRTPNCQCKCANITWEEVYEQVEEVKKELTVDKKLLSKQKRKKVTVEDTRPASTGVGYVGAAFLVVVFGSILVIDLMSAGRYILGRIDKSRRARQNRDGCGVSHRRKHLLHVQPEGIVLHMMDQKSRKILSRRRVPSVGS
ncbi:uncharacterized protein LOC121376561 isoform X2 [Gigantopelta aegis]|uniref:uncharacterized protein LOC121376561 isoform X2 n=2 Tax=Gigantopelta aegis TaxID=1735272 RepID=UPI001B8890A2|nr:uncharacterized protein LOC121376561 isoform X2 [Gigantopelta aegis]